MAMDPTSNNAASATRSYLDFDGLGQLKGQARQDAKAATKETAQQFEALFIQMMLKSMREAVDKDESSESSAKQTFEGMFDHEISVQMAKRGTMGLSDMLVKNLSATEASTSTAAMLQAREAAAPMPLNATAKARALSLQVPDASALPLPRNGPIPLEDPRLKRNAL